MGGAVDARALSAPLLIAYRLPLKRTQLAKSILGITRRHKLRQPVPGATPTDGRYWDRPSAFAITAAPVSVGKRTSAVVQKSHRRELWLAPSAEDG